MNFDDLKKQMDSFDFNGVAKELKEKEGKTSFNDPRFFKAKKDSSGNISCVIRFLPQKDFKKSPYIEIKEHFVKDFGKIFVDSCPNMVQADSCKCCQDVGDFWDEYNIAKESYGKDSKECKSILKKINNYKQMTRTVTNIQVIRNEIEPDTVGKVFLYNVPKSIMDKYKAKLMPEDDYDEPVIVYHPLKGREFKLSAVTEASEAFTGLKYDKSEFYDKDKPISENKEELMRVLNECYDLDEYMKEITPDVEKVNKKFMDFKKSTPKASEKSEMKKEDFKQENLEEDSADIEEVEEISMDEIDSLFD